MVKKQIPSQTIREIITRNDLVEIIQSRLNLVKRGHNYLARCPFHEEKTPSFTVNSEKQFYYCFGCGAHGNAISFLMNYDHLEFIEALEYLASQQGIELTYSIDTQDDKLFKEATEVLQQVTAYYTQTLKKSNKALEYIKQRHLSAEICQRFMIGYAPAGWSNLQQNFKMNSKLQQILLDNGLYISKKSGGYYDRFRDRIIFPIQDMHGHIIGYGGRTLDNETQPKYLNSPETALFKKNQELYGLHQVKQTNAKINSILVVEGYLDVLTLHQHQFTNAVATMGTAINQKHIQKLIRYTSKIIFCFDGDTAGQQAAWKALTICLPLLKDGLDILFLLLAAGEDPDSILNTRGVHYFKELLQDALPLSDYFFQNLQQQIDPSTTEGKVLYIKQALTFLNKMPTGIYRHLLLQQLAKKVDIELKQLQAISNPSQIHALDIKKNEKKSQVNLPIPRNIKNIDLSQPINSALTLLLKQPELARTTNIDLLSSLNSQQNFLLIKLIKIFQKNPTLSMSELLAQLDSPEEQHLIAKLGVKKLIIPETGIAEEYKGAIACLIQKNLDEKIRLLIVKAKQQGLNEIEKKQLQLLIESKHQ